MLCAPLIFALLTYLWDRALPEKCAPCVKSSHGEQLKQTRLPTRKVLWRIAVFLIALGVVSAVIASSLMGIQKKGFPGVGF